MRPFSRGGAAPLANRRCFPVSCLDGALFVSQVHVPPELLQRAIAASLPAFPLALQTLPGDTGLRLWLLDPEAGKTRLASDAARRVAAAPPYWSLCWAAGLTVANYIHRHPERVRGCSVIDFGAGSGVVALAAARAGARRVVAVDQDPLALEACRANAAANGVEIECAPGLEALEGRFDLLTATDIFYESANINLLPLFEARAARLLLGDARRKDLGSFGFRQLATVQGTTVPAFGDPQFERVEVYEG